MVGFPTDDPMATDSLTDDRMAIGSPIVPAKVAAARSGIATTGRTGQPIIDPIEFPIAIGGTIGAAIIATTAGNTGTLIGAIMMTGTTTIGG
jgi:hypothetical protein